jgi:hypothetical protein
MEFVIIVLAVLVGMCIGASCLVVIIRRDNLAAIWFLLLGILFELILIRNG